MAGFVRLFFGGHQIRERLRFWRFCMVLAGLGPLFVLMAVKGNDVVPDLYWSIICGFLVFFPVAALFGRLVMVYRTQTPRPVAVVRVEDSRSHVLVYLFATLLPFYRQNIMDPRDLSGILLAIALIIFLFWHLNLHYMNIVLAIFGFRVYTIHPSDDSNLYSNRIPIVVITRQRFLVPGSTIQGYRMSDTLYWGIK